MGEVKRGLQSPYGRRIQNIKYRGDDFINIAYNQDCITALKETPDNYYDLAVVDPPYGSGTVFRKSRGGRIGRGRMEGYGRALTKDYKPFDDIAPPPEYFAELMRVSKNQVIFGANHFISRMPYDSACWLIWDKENDETDFADCELAWTSFKKKAARIFRFKWNGMLQGNMKNKEFRIHPTQKPVELYAWIYKKFAKEGDRILDTHLGSGSSRIAAYELGLDFVGYEIDKDHFDNQEKRFAEHTAQLRFDSPNVLERR